MKIKNYILSLLFLTVSLGFINAQIILMGDPGFPQSGPMDCNIYGDPSMPNFYDQGGSGGNYTANYNNTITFCPDLAMGTKVTLKFAINTGFTFNVDGSDTIYVYDGPNTSSPLIGAHNSVTDPIGFNHVASFSNPSGCITVRFVTNGANENTGWEANVTCGNPPQPFEVHMEAFINNSMTNDMSPVDTGYVDVCFGDSILFVAKPIFPYSFESTGNGYSQNLNNVTYDWSISNAGTLPNNDSVWFTPPARAGYLVTLKITDAFPQSERIVSKVRVSTLPSFAGTGPLEDTVCLGSNTVLLGGVTATDTVGIEIPPGSFSLGGAFAGLTYLPDGSGAQYQAPVTISGFPDSAVIVTPQDLNKVCITMEHSYLGDLEIALQCPNGTQVALVNSYSPGFIPGGFNGGGTYLGDADDATADGNPGIGWEYCFSSVYNDWGTMGTEFAGGNTVPTTVTPGNQSMNPNGIYLPETSFVGFAGCPINGQWTIIVQDNLGIDDGYIFEWGLFFDPSLLPGLENYNNIVVSDFWSNDPTIISGQNDTSIVIQPNSPGSYGYTYNITDDFGCVYDTTVILYVLPQPTIFSDTISCNFMFQVNNTTSFQGGVWSAADTSIHFAPDSSFQNPIISTTNGDGGIFNISYTDNACNTTVSAVLNLPGNVFADVKDTAVCAGKAYMLTAEVYPQGTPITWNTGATGPTIEVTTSGFYIATASNACYSFTDTAYVDMKLCDIEAPNVLLLGSTVGNNLWFVQADGISEFNCIIVNRWGNTIYEWDDVKAGWNGESQKGNVVDDGVYFYTIKAKDTAGNEVLKHGSITVRR